MEKAFKVRKLDGSYSIFASAEARTEELKQVYNINNQ
jgi:hypothetical protein